jgi:hypothetical protein
VLIHELEGNRDVRNLYRNIADKMRNGGIRVFTPMSETRRSLQLNFKLRGLDITPSRLSQIQTA